MYALVTGASGGIGRAIALKLAEEGYSLYLHYYQNKSSIESLLQELEPFNREYIPIQADLSSPEGYKEIVNSIFSIDAIIHNSGISHYGLLTDIDPETVEKIMRVHVTNPLLLTKELIPKMLLKHHGNIIMISSIWGQTGAACEVAYSTAKGGQIAFVKALSKELARNGIRVNGVAPGAVQTAMLTSFSEEDLSNLEDEIPLGKVGSAENIADAVSFLLSEKSSYITGHILPVNGGWYV